MVSLDMVDKVPLLTIGRVTINTIELFDTLMFLSVRKKIASSSERLATNVTRETFLSFVNNVDVLF